jgi:NAD(P)-dependent dehydrogenase (short-subunit alcohol dehydrogenase family)
MPRFDHVLIVGAGEGLSASLARAFAREGATIALAARRPEKLEGLCRELGATAHRCDAAEPADVAALFRELDEAGRTPAAVVYNPSRRSRGPLVDLDPEEVRQDLLVTAYGGFLVAQEAVRRMLPRRVGAVVFTGASASVKGYARSSSFAMGKFALRGLAQSMSRELHPKGIHVAHIVIDGGIKSERRHEEAGKTASLLNPTSIAATYLHVIHQPHSAWSAEVELRPWVESF